MRKRIFCLLFALALLLTAFPINVLAEEGYTLIVGGTAVSSENAKDIFGDGSAVFDYESGTLTLKKANIICAKSTDMYAGIIADLGDKNFTVAVAEESNISSPKFKDETPEALPFFGIYSASELTIKGELLKLALAAGEQACGIYSEKGLTFEKSNAYIDAVKQKTAFGAYGKTLLCINDANLEIYATTAAIRTEGSLIFKKGTSYMSKNEPTESTPYGFSILFAFRDLTVIWKNYDGTVLETDNDIPYNTYPSYDGKTPEKPSDSEYCYVFKGWDKPLSRLTADTVFTAEFDAAPLEEEKAVSQPTVEEIEDTIINPSNNESTDDSNAFASFLPLKLSAKAKNRTVTLSWSRVSGADGYIIYGAAAGKKMKKLKTVRNPKAVKYTFKKLKKGTYYKYVVIAYKNTSLGQRSAAVSLTVYCTTEGGKYGNPTGVKLKRSAVTLKKGKTKTLKPSLASKKKVKRCGKKFRYASSNKAVVTVSKAGKIKAKKKGTAYVYVIAQNGKYKKIKITVK